MPRRAQLLADNYYHLYVSAQSEAVLFEHSAEYTHFLKIYAQLIEPVAQTFAYCLLPNHFHFFIRIKTMAEQIEDWYVQHSAETPPPEYQPIEPDTQINTLLTHLPIKSTSLNIIPVGNQRHCAYLIRYIHQNPALHGHIKNFRHWPHSSYQTILADKPTRIPIAKVLEWFHSAEWYEEIHWETQDPTEIGYLILED